MSGNIIGSVIGATIGFFLGGPLGALQGAAIGSAIGGALMPADLPTQYGPRLDDLKAQQSEYGSAIPIVYGTVALQGTVIWAADIKEVKTETEQGGGTSEPSYTVVNYSYFASFAVAVCEGPITGFLRIWAGPEKRLIYDGTNIQGGQIRFYTGAEDQMPDPLIEASKGVGFASAYRGTAYVVLEDFPLDKDFNRIPFLTIEVLNKGTGSVNTCAVDYKLVGDLPFQSRLYDVPPVKLGNFGAGATDADKRYLSSGAHPYAFDSFNNLYLLINGYVNGGYRWYLKKISTTAPIKETEMYLGDEFNHVSVCSIAYDPNRNVLGIIQENQLNYVEVDCATFTGQYSTLDFYKQDIIFSEAEQRFRFLNARSYYPGGVPHPDNYGLNYIWCNELIECGPHGIAVRAQFRVYLNGSMLIDGEFNIYDPVRDRLFAVIGDQATRTGYYDFATGQVVTPATKINESFRLNAAYFPLIDRVIWNDANGLYVSDPALMSSFSIPTECQLFSGQLVYADGSKVNEWGGILHAIPIPGKRTQIVVVNGGNWNYSELGNDVFLFTVGARGDKVTLASVIADLSERAGEPRYDVSELENDFVDGYVIARQTEVRAAMQPLRSAYYFDAVESQGVVRFVKRGGLNITIINDADLSARDQGAESPDPLQTKRRIENELPRSVTIKYLLAADDYNEATKQARRLIGASGDEITLEVPLVLTDTKAQEIAQVNLHSAWVERLSYSFTLPRKYSYLEPTDLVLVKGHLMRLTSIKASPRGVLECTALADETKYYAPHIIVTETPPNEGTVTKPGQTRLELF